MASLPSKSNSLPPRSLTVHPIPAHSWSNPNNFSQHLKISIQIVIGTKPGTGLKVSYLKISKCFDGDKIYRFENMVGMSRLIMTMKYISKKYNIFLSKKVPWSRDKYKLVTHSGIGLVSCSASQSLIYYLLFNPHVPL